MKGAGVVHSTCGTKQRWHIIPALLGGILMQIRPVPSCAKRMAVLLCVVAAIDAAAALLIPKPQVWCAIIPALLPLFTPLAIYKRSRAVNTTQV
jgi:hypothetical protein